MNENGQVVGWSYTYHDVFRHAFSWTREGGMIELGTLGGSYGEAVAVNRTGQVAGYTNTRNDAAYHAALWTDIK